ncbi:MAG: sulfate permease, SulP family [Methylobacteriaceae bacterium]|jgi:SulP family sulfate permease|nr:sulfate permease, SulP family [Methylobacteriaceae bacterium]
MSLGLSFPEQVLRPAAAGTVTAVWTVVASIAYATLVFSGPLAPALAVGLSTVLSGFVISSVVIALGSGLTGMTASNLTVAAPVYAAMGVAISSEFTRMGLTDPFTQAAAVSLASGAATLLTGLSFVALASFRLGSLGQLLPYPVISGYNSGIGWFLLVGGLKLTIDQPLGINAAHLLDAHSIAQLAAVVITATVLVIAPRRILHWAVLPSILIAAVLLFQVFRLAAGLDVATAQATHWVFGPFTGSFLHLPAVMGVAGLDFDLTRRLAPYIVGSVFIAAVTQILVLSALENDLRRSFALNHELTMAGAANIAGGLVGGLPTGQALAATVLLNQQTGPSRFGALIPALWGAILLLAGPTLLAYLPRFAVGALLIAVGLDRFLLRIVGDARVNPVLETVIAVIVSLSIIFLGILNGMAIGIAAAIVLFAYNYRRIPIVWATLSGAEVRSNVVRSPEVMRLLEAQGARIVLFRLQGYLFFLNVSSVRAAVEKRADEKPALNDIVFDFRDVVGMDSSALMAFRRIGQIAEEKKFRVTFAGLHPDLRDLFERAMMWRDEGILCVETADRALQSAEDRLVAESEKGRFSYALTLSQALAAFAPGQVPEGRLARYLEHVELQPNEVLMHLGDAADAMFFVEAGQVTAELQREGTAPLRLQTSSPGALTGEIALFRGGVRTASVRAEGNCRLARLSKAALERMEKEDADLAQLIHRFIIVQLADKVANTTRIVDVGLH